MTAVVVVWMVLITVGFAAVVSFQQAQLAKSRRLFEMIADLRRDISPAEFADGTSGDDEATDAGGESK